MYNVGKVCNEIIEMICALPVQDIKILSVYFT